MYQEPTLTFRRLVKYSLVILVVVSLVGYGVWQARLLIIGPVIDLTEETTTIQNERVITLSGNASNIVGITLNGRTIFTDKNGNFEEKVVLENGYSVVTLAGTDRYGRTTFLEREFVYTPIVD